MSAKDTGGAAFPNDVVPWLYVIRSEFLPDDANLGRESDTKMREALDYATAFVAGHRECLAPEYPPKTASAYAALEADGWQWNGDDWTRPPTTEARGVR